MVDQFPITANELANEAGLSSECLDLAFREEHAHLLAEFCDPWEEIGYHLRLAKSKINCIKEDNATTEKRRIGTLQEWKERFAHRATYRVLIEALIGSGRAQQALDLCIKMKGLRPASESEGTSVMPRDPSLLTTAPTSPVDRDSSSEEFNIPDVDISQSIKSLQTRFIHIQNRFLQSDAAGTGVTLQQLQTCISTLPAFSTDTPQALLEVGSILHFAHNLKQYCCALDPDILESLIEVLGDTETKSMMNVYSRALHNFLCKTKLKDFIGNYAGPTPPDVEYKEVQIKFGDSWREKTLADVKQMKSQISRRSWFLKMVSIGSVHVIFMIPQVEDLELDVHLRIHLQSQGVLQIFVCGVCIFNSEGK